VFRFEIAYLLGAIGVNSLWRQGFCAESRPEPCSRDVLGCRRRDLRCASRCRL